MRATTWTHLNHAVLSEGRHAQRAMHFTFLKILFIFRERGKEGEREGNIHVWLPLVCPLLEIWPATQACALTGNWTGDPLVSRPALNPLGHTMDYQLWYQLHNIFQRQNYRDGKQLLGAGDQERGWLQSTGTIWGSDRTVSYPDCGAVSGWRCSSKLHTTRVTLPAYYTLIRNGKRKTFKCAYSLWITFEHMALAQWWN